MYKVMIADDEPLVRLAIKSLVDWEEHGFNLEIEASNGRQALKLLEDNPDMDIIITDINMPVMDGLELISKVIEKRFDTEIIVLSAYNDYAWIREAFKLGVNDYILKTAMEPQNLLDILQTTAKKIDKKKNMAQRDKSDYIDREKHYQKELILKSLLYNVDIKNVKEDALSAGIKIFGRYSSVCYIWIDDYQTIEKRYQSSTLRDFTQSVLNAILQVISETNAGEIICVSPQEYVLFLAFKDYSLNRIRGKLVGILGRIKHAIQNYVNVSVTIGVSDIKIGTDSFATLFEQAERNAKLRFIFGKGRIIFPEDVKKINSYETESLIGKESEFINALNSTDIDKALYELEKLFDIIKRNECSKIEKIYSNYMELIFITATFLCEKGSGMEEIFGKEIDFYEKILSFETREEINSWIRNIITWIVNSMQENKNTKISKVILNARNFIKENYANDNLSLRQVSEYVQLSESYFSTIFTKEIGTTFTDYLTNIRIEKAKDLLESTNLKIYEISEKVGYTNKEHFSRIFKRHVGVSPKDYKFSNYRIKNQ
jgi:two-component system response regulator YesN